MRVGACSLNLNTFDAFRSYYMVGLQQGRAQLDSDANQGQRATLQPSLGIASVKDRFESPKHESWISKIWYHPSRKE